ncbi:MAG: PspC domain-containing protein, partial [Bacteroidota bacterium]|nr:PspC domain-containing protein [Bacteroidota bacterium]
MKKTFTINISGTIFHIDEDAYEKLRNYLGLIHKRFSKNEEGKEIILDIESRIAELFTDCLQESKEVVSLGDVEEVIEIMGDPNEFDEAEESSSETEYKPGSKFKTGKRLYRDSDTRIFGGVAAGIGAYFGIDPVIIRILFIITAFFQIGIVAYVILWIAVPLARTTAQKLEMRGERVTVSNIEKSITEEFDEVKSNFRNFKNSKGYTRTKENISPVLEGLGLVFIAVGKILVVLFGISFIVLGVLVIFGFVGTFYSGYWFGFSPFEFDLLSDTGLFGWIADINNIRILTVSLILLIGIPILAIIYGGIKMIFRFNANHKLVGGIGLSLWVVGLIMAVAAVFMEASNFKSNSIERSTHELNEFNSPVLFVNTFPDTLSDYFKYDYVFGMGEVKVVHDIDDYRIFIEPKIKIVKSNEDYFEMI